MMGYGAPLKGRDSETIVRLGAGVGSARIARAAHFDRNVGC